MQKSFLLHWVARVCGAEASDKWSLTPKILFSCFGSKYECFYSNVKSGRFKGLERVTSLFWKRVLKTWIDSNGDVPNESPSTALWNNKYVVYNGPVLFFQKNDK